MASDETGHQQAKEQEPKDRLPVHLDPSQGERTQFKPGQSGNPAGQPKGKSLSSTIQDMLDDEKFIERLSKKIKDRIIDMDDPDGMPDPDFQGTPMRAIITTALIESMAPNARPGARIAARYWLAPLWLGYGTKRDVTSKGQRISESPKIISVINARQDNDAPTETEAS